jgi:hypothetical protein
MTSLTRLLSYLCVVATIALAPALAEAKPEPIPAESFAKVPNIQSVSMSADGKMLVALIAAPGSDNEDTALATWNLNDLDAGPTITPSGDRMKFIAASALKADRLLVFARQEWTGRLGGCGEGKSTGATKTFVNKLYLTDAEHDGFEEAFADNTRRLGVSEATQRCLELAGTASLVNTLPLDPERVIISQLNNLTFQSNFFLYNLKTGETELLLRAGGRTTPSLFDPRTGELLIRTEIEASGANEYEQRILFKDPATGEFEVHDNLSRPLSERYASLMTSPWWPTPNIPLAASFWARNRATSTKSWASRWPVASLRPPMSTPK